jgi:hypothetical protein
MKIKINTNLNVLLLLVKEIPKSRNERNVSIVLVFVHNAQDKTY